MELRRSRVLLVFAVLMVLFGAWIALGNQAYGTLRSIIGGIVGGATVVLGIAFLVSSLRPFRFHIGPDGLTLRLKGINRLVPWHELDAVVIDQATPVLVGNKTPPVQLFVVPAPGSSLRAEASADSAVDGHDAMVLLDLEDVRQSPEKIAEALARYAGGRFTDRRAQRRAPFAAPEFTVTLRGYDTAKVDELLRKGHEALLSGSTITRLGVKAEIESAKLPVAGHGYDRGQVDAMLAALSAELAAWTAEPPSAAAEPPTGR